MGGGGQRVQEGETFPQGFVQDVASAGSIRGPATTGPFGVPAASHCAVAVASQIERAHF